MLALRAHMYLTGSGYELHMFDSGKSRFLRKFDEQIVSSTSAVTHNRVIIDECKDGFFFEYNVQHRSCFYESGVFKITTDEEFEEWCKLIDGLGWNYVLSSDAVYHNEEDLFAVSN